MSRGTTFKILRRSRASVSQNFCEDLRIKYMKAHEGDEPLMAKDTSPKYPKFLDSGVDSFDIMKTDTGKPYVTAMEFTFNSVFGEMRERLTETFDMNAYSPWRSQAAISTAEAREMLIAANYVLLGHFDRKVEEVMDNRYIEPIGSMSAEYQEWRYRLDFPNDTEPYHEEDNSEAVRRFRSMLEAFLGCDDPGEYILVAEIWW